MNVEVRIRKIFQNEDRMKALVSITLDGVFAVHDIKVIQGQERLFVAMPSRKQNDGAFRDIAHPVGMEMRRQIEDAVFREYKWCYGAESEESCEE